jgi:hypothetical protein
MANMMTIQEARYLPMKHHNVTMDLLSANAFVTMRLQYDD